MKIAILDKEGTPFKEIKLINDNKNNLNQEVILNIKAKYIKLELLDNYEGGYIELERLKFNIENFDSIQ